MPAVTSAALSPSELVLSGLDQCASPERSPHRTHQAFTVSRIRRIELAKNTIHEASCALTQPSDEAIASRPAAAHAWSCIPSGAPPTPMPAIDAGPAFTVTPPARKRVPGRSAMVDPSPFVRCVRSLVSAPKAAEVYAFSREASTVCWAALSPRTMAMTLPARSTTETVTNPSPSARHFARAAPAAFTAASALSRF